MKVILTDYVYKHGVAGEVVNVADGFARNYLIPRKLAIPATKQNLEHQADLRAKAAENRFVVNSRISEAAAKINGVELVFGVKAGTNNKLYGSITSQMIKDAIQEKTGVDINRRRISERVIRELGRYDVPVRMGDVSPVVQVLVVREEEVAQLAARTAAEAAAAEASAAEASVAEAAAEAPAAVPTVSAVESGEESVVEAEATPAAETPADSE